MKSCEWRTPLKRPEQLKEEAKWIGGCPPSIAQHAFKQRLSRFEQLFLHYGAGSKIFKPLTTSPLWNRFCWTLIVLGILGWLAMFWLLGKITE